MTASTASASKFDHLVVLMFENRSFDNLLGQLYAPGEVPSFEGTVGKDLRNPIPPGLDGSDRQYVPFHPAASLDSPDPDPGEEFPHTNTQLYGTVDPPENRFRPVREMQAPYNAPPSVEVGPTMEGFVADYVSAFQEQMGRAPVYREYAEIMAGYTPDQLPVLSTLARGFTCFDHWFCEVPSQTYPNRSFVHAASSSGFVVNDPVENFVLRNDAPTIFERLEAAHLPWKVYIDPEQVVSVTGLIHARRLAPYFETRFATIYDFYADAAAGALPAYAFLEPNLVHPHTDMHPPGAARLRHDLHLPPPASMLGGERLLARVYEAVRTAASSSGSNWSNTLLLVTFDEHGGTYDHVPPPRVVAPTPGAPPGQMGFTFERSGVRIPALAVSAWVEPGTVVTSEYRSCSIVRTLRERWSLGEPLTARDGVAPDLAPVLTREKPRPPSEWPPVAARPLGLLDTARLLVDRPLTTLGRHLLEAAVVHEVHATGTPVEVDLPRIAHRAAQARLRTFRKATFAGVRNGRQT
jgi:phospholipase C